MILLHSVISLQDAMSCNKQFHYIDKSYAKDQFKSKNKVLRQNMQIDVLTQFDLKTLFNQFPVTETFNAYPVQHM